MSYLDYKNSLTFGSISQAAGALRDRNTGLLNAGLASNPPNFVLALLINSSRRESTSSLATASLDFKRTLPVNPSVTTTSASPANNSLPSTLPMKLIPLVSKRG